MPWACLRFQLESKRYVGQAKSLCGVSWFGSVRAMPGSRDGSSHFSRVGDVIPGHKQGEPALSIYVQPGAHIYFPCRVSANGLAVPKGVKTEAWLGACQFWHHVRPLAGDWLRNLRVRNILRATVVCWRNGAGLLRNLGRLLIEVLGTQLRSPDRHVGQPRKLREHNG